MRIFVPGRICLFGEHSDWAGGYRRTNSQIDKGYAIIVGTDQGLSAEVSRHPNLLQMNSDLGKGRHESFEVEMRRETLLEAAEAGGTFSYACGVAYTILTHYSVRGLTIVNDRTDLPVGKGLSSSAAVCVLVARAFNRLYDLKMTVRGEMEYAYQGEITTPSRCGRMDQGCAYGGRPILMTFDGDRIDVEELRVAHDLHYLIVDLKAGKDTREILGRLNAAYPFPETDLERSVVRYLGPVNKSILARARAALERGNATELGRLMSEAQFEFDRHLIPACPSQLTAPVLHRLLADSRLASIACGGKGVGSQGDGTAQLLFADEESRERGRTVVGELGMSTLPLTIRAQRRVRKAVIPAAGFGTRLFPASKAVKKEIFPVVDASGKAKPAIVVIAEELLASGIEQIALVIQRRDQETFESLFHSPVAVENYNRLSVEDRRLSDEMLSMGTRIDLVYQDAQEGFGHAVYCAREWVGDEPFLLALGDCVYASDTEVSCTRQLLEAQERYGVSAVGVKEIRESEVGRFGCVAGTWEEEHVVEIAEFAEKPTPEYARDRLAVAGLPAGIYLGLFGQYVLSPRIFEILRENIESNRRESGEFQLTSCLDRLRVEEGFVGYRVQGRSYDIGVPAGYRQALIELAACSRGTGADLQPQAPVNPRV